MFMNARIMLDFKVGWFTYKIITEDRTWLVMDIEKVDRFGKYLVPNGSAMNLLGKKWS